MTSVKGNIPLWKAFFYYPFLFFCMFPFILGNPYAESDLQPYAFLLSLFVVIINFSKSIDCGCFRKYFYPSLFLVFFATIILFLSGLSTSSFRGYFNYLSVFFVPCALIYVLRDFEGIPEGFLKLCIMIWFFVSSYQFFIDRSFAFQVLGNARGADTSRGVIGLASEPSFFGIGCFYMLHLATEFKTSKWLFVGMIMIMGTIYAQSTLGILFIAVYWFFLVLDQLPHRRGFILLAVSVILVAAFLYVLTTRLSGTRVYNLITAILNEGAMGIEDDTSVEVRYNSLWGAIEGAFESYLMPSGFAGRIGSAYGGFLRELGFLSIPFLISLSYVLSCSFHTQMLRIMYFIAFTILMFNNTQLGNPLLLTVVAVNAYSCGDNTRKRPLFRIWE